MKRKHFGRVVCVSVSVSVSVNVIVIVIVSVSVSVREGWTVVERTRD